MTETWFVFDNPGGSGLAYVPAETEEQARRQMQNMAYVGATWPFEVACVGSRVCSREALTVSLLSAARAPTPAGAAAAPPARPVGRGADLAPEGSRLARAAGDVHRVLPESGGEHCGEIFDAAKKRPAAPRPRLGADLDDEGVLGRPLPVPLRLVDGGAREGAVAAFEKPEERVHERALVERDGDPAVGGPVEPALDGDPGPDSDARRAHRRQVPTVAPDEEDPTDPAMMAPSGSGFTHEGSLAGERFGFKGRHVRAVPLHDFGVYFTLEECGELSFVTSPTMNAGGAARRLRKLGAVWDPDAQVFRGRLRADEQATFSRVLRSLVEVFCWNEGL